MKIIGTVLVVSGLFVLANISAAHAIGVAMYVVGYGLLTVPSGRGK